MGLESVVVPVLPDQLNANWPLPEDPKSQGDDHIRNVKAALVNFFGKVNFDGLNEGSVPVFLNGQFWNSGFDFSGGQATLFRPFVAPMHIQAEGLNPNKYQLIGVSLSDSAVKRPETPTANALYELDIQLVDSSTNSAPIAWAFTQDSDAWVKGIIIRGAAAASRVRITLRDTNSSGPILYQTASDAELVAGGGASIAASGETTVLFPQKLEMFNGNHIYVVVDRYDSVAGVFTGAGISLKGTTISGQFIPYQRSIRQAVVRRPVAIRSDIPTRSYQMNSNDQSIGTTAVVIGTFTFYNGSDSTAFGVDVSAFFSVIPNASLTLNVYVNNVLVDLGGGFTSRVDNAIAGRAFAVTVTVPATLTVNASHTVRVEALVSTTTMTKKTCRVAFNRLDSGDTWA